MAAVREVLERLGRTEDARFSPSGRRLALAGFQNDRIALAEVELDGAAVVVTRIQEIASSSLREPHGVDFLDDETLVVGNRGGGVVVFRLPDAWSDEGVDRLEPLGPAVQTPVEGPGSVRIGSGLVLVCNNWTSTITRHTAAPGGGLDTGEVIAAKWLDLPDGLALSRDGRWLAISNHDSHTVLVQPYPPVGEDDEPVAILRGVLYPHGMCFSRDDRYLLVADAGRPYVLVFPVGDGWHGVRYPDAALRVMDDETYARGRSNDPAEGGPKGIDIHPRENVLAVTSELVPLAFFDLDEALDQAEPIGNGSLEYELQRLAETKDARAEGIAIHAHLFQSRLEVAQLHRRRRRWRIR